MMLGDDAGADGAAALADREAQLLFHRDRHDQRALPSRCCRPASPSRCLRQRHDTGHVGGAEVELRTIVGEERRVPAALSLVRM
jgi:hypothetical protein